MKKGDIVIYKHYKCIIACDIPGSIIVELPSEASFGWHRSDDSLLIGYRETLSGRFWHVSKKDLTFHEQVINNSYSIF